MFSLIALRKRGVRILRDPVGNARLDPRASEEHSKGESSRDVSPWLTPKIEGQVGGEDASQDRVSLAPPWNGRRKGRRTRRGMEKERW